MAQQKKLLAAFVNKQQKVMYGLAWEPVLGKLAIFAKNKDHEKPKREWPTQEIIEAWPLE